jgi:hypothetical protein
MIRQPMPKLARRNSMSEVIIWLDVQPFLIINIAPVRLPTNAVIKGVALRFPPHLQNVWLCFASYAPSR